MIKHNRQAAPSTLDNYGTEHINRFKSPARIPPSTIDCSLPLSIITDDNLEFCHTCLFIMLRYTNCVRYVALNVIIVVNDEMERT
jgi:hypothetical protein